MTAFVICQPASDKWQALYGRNLVAALSGTQQKDICLLDIDRLLSSVTHLRFTSTWNLRLVLRLPLDITFGGPWQYLWTAPVCRISCHYFTHILSVLDSVVLEHGWIDRKLHRENGAMVFLQNLYYVQPCPFNYVKISLAFRKGVAAHQPHTSNLIPCNSSFTICW